MTTEKFQWLLDRYLNGRLSNRELDRFCAALDKPEHQEQVLAYLESTLKETTTMSDQEFTDKGYEQLLEMINHGRHDPGSVVLPMAPERHIGREILKYAAIFIIGIAVSITVWYQLATRQSLSETSNGKEKAAQQVVALHHPYIVFADGDIVVLDSLAEKSLRLRQLGTAIDYKNKRVTFPTPGQPSDSRPQIAKLVTPRRCQYSIMLADSSTIWLNASSELQFPVQFTGPQRQVALKGEAYFDVRPNEALPFRVGIGPVAITVLGTQFNIHAYPSDSTLRTTLISGKVDVSRESKHSVLSAGQSLLITRAEWKLYHGVDTSQALAWRQQLFDFRKADLQTILPELARWYDITYELAPNIKKNFTGKIPRTADLTTVLEILKESGIGYRQEGKKIVFF